MTYKINVIKEIEVADEDLSTQIASLIADNFKITRLQKIETLQ